MSRSTAETVGVVGLGAVGTVVAAAWHQVVACGRRPLDRVEVADEQAREATRSGGPPSRPTSGTSLGSSWRRRCTRRPTSRTGSGRWQARAATCSSRRTASTTRTGSAVCSTAGPSCLPDGTAEQTLDWLQHLPPGSASSMLQDREAGRPLEYDGLTGTVVRLGDQHGVPVETNRTLLALLANLAPTPPLAE